MTFILFHGSYGTPQGNWFPDLKKELQKLKHHVISPQFPIDNWDTVTQNGPEALPVNQNLTSWLMTFEDIWSKVSDRGPFGFIGHSLGSLFILHIVSKYKIFLEKAIFVSPFLEYLGKSWQIDIVNQSFYKTDFNFLDLQKLMPSSCVIYGDNDPYVASGISQEFANNLNSRVWVIKNGGHLNSESGYDTFPELKSLIKNNKII